MKSYKFFICILYILFYENFVFSQKTEIYTQIPAEYIQVTASSSFPRFPATAIIDGSGMIGETHESQRQGLNMWLSEISTQAVRANEHTPEGAIWLMLELDDKIDRIDNIRIWNHNQNFFTNRGLKKVYL